MWNYSWPDTTNWCSATSLQNWRSYSLSICRWWENIGHSSYVHTIKKWVIIVDYIRLVHPLLFTNGMYCRRVPGLKCMHCELLYRSVKSARFYSHIMHLTVRNSSTSRVTVFLVHVFTETSIPSPRRDSERWEVDWFERLG